MSTQFPTLAQVLTLHRLQSTEINGRELFRCSCLQNVVSTGTADYDMHVEQMRRQACTIRTIDQLDALPLDTVVVDAAGIPRTKRHRNSHMAGGWTHAGNSPLTSAELADGRDMVVVWHPDWLGQ